MVLAPTHLLSPAATLQASAAQVDAGATASDQAGSLTITSLARREHRAAGDAAASSCLLSFFSSPSVTPNTLAPKEAIGRAPAFAMSYILSLPLVVALRILCTNLSRLVSMSMRAFLLTRPLGVPLQAPAW